MCREIHYVKFCLTTIYSLYLRASNYTPKFTITKYYFVPSFRDISALARAAVSGDESALDMFNWKSNLGTRPSHFGAPAEALGFYVGTREG